ncbi:MAG: ABC transporter permease [Chloroflexi bacterium]|nr:ABC transporter permease [Chloroflexota bacterium]
MTGRALKFFQTWPVFPLAILIALIVCGIFAPLISPHDPIESNLRSRNAPPVWLERGTSKHLLGADPLGRDILSRVIHGARVSLLVAAVSIGSGLTVGVTLGLLSGYYGGAVDELIMRLADVSRAVPYILIALVVAIVLGQSLAVILGVLAFATWSVFARQVRAEVLVLKEMDYVSLARIAGAGAARIMIRHILPGVLNTVTVVATLQVGSLMLTEAILSFLGAGIPPPTPAWGVMVAEGRDYLTNAWWVSFFPGAAIFLTVLSLNFLGDWLRDRLDPRLRQL